MALLSVVAVLLIEQIRPLPYRWLVVQPLARLAGFLEATFNAGGRRHAEIAWLAGVGGVTLVAAAAYAALYQASPLLAGLWTIIVLYLTMGFRQFSHYFTDIQLALRMDDLAHARLLLGQWLGRPVDTLTAAEVARLAIEQALACAHRHVFGVLLCFFLLPGPCGAVLYRAAAFFAEHWGRRSATDEDSGHFGVFAQHAFALVDWLPLRFTAACFAVVGNFEDAVYGWRTQADRWPDSPFGRDIGIVLASAAGALGVRLGRPTDTGSASDTGERGEAGAQLEADVDSMQGAVALVWRALLLCLALLLLLGLSNLIAS